MRQDRQLTDIALMGHDLTTQFLNGTGGSGWFAPFAVKLAEMADLRPSPHDRYDPCNSINWQRFVEGKLKTALTQGWMKRSSLRQPPLTHGGDIDAVLITRVTVHGIRPVPFDGGSPEHWEGKRKGCWWPNSDSSQLIGP